MTTSDDRSLDAFFHDCATPLAIVGSGGTVSRANDAFARAMSANGLVTGRSFDSLVQTSDRARVKASFDALEAGDLTAVGAVRSECGRLLARRAGQFSLAHSILCGLRSRFLRRIERQQVCGDVAESGSSSTVWDGSGEVVLCVT